MSHHYNQSYAQSLQIFLTWINSSIWQTSASSMEELLGGNQTKLQGSYFSLQSWVHGQSLAATMYLMWVSFFSFFFFFLHCWLMMARMYTHKMSHSAITSLVENARCRYLKTSQPNVVIHTTGLQQIIIRSASPHLKAHCQELTVVINTLVKTVL